MSVTSKMPPTTGEEKHKDGQAPPAERESGSKPQPCRQGPGKHGKGQSPGWGRLESRGSDNTVVANTETELFLS